MDSAVLALGATVFIATVVEMVEALTIVLAIGVTRGWRAALAGTATALLALFGFTLAAGYALATWLPEAALQLTIGTLLLVFGLQWLRKAVLRASGRKALHDEEVAYVEQTAAARTAAGRNRAGIDWFGFVVSFKGVFLEGVEVVFIVITFGLNADNIPMAAAGAGAGVMVVLALALVVRGPLTRAPENALKYGVGLLLATFGTFWAVEGLGTFGADRQSLEWVGADLFLIVLLAGWWLVTRGMIRLLKLKRPSSLEATAVDTVKTEGLR